jgi:hypothetical protein
MEEASKAETGFDQAGHISALPASDAGHVVTSGF